MNPVNIGLFAAIGVMLEANRISDLIQKLFSPFNHTDVAKQESAYDLHRNKRGKKEHQKKY
jgi:hypothetical protein